MWNFKAKDKISKKLGPRDVYEANTKNIMIAHSAKALFKFPLFNYLLKQLDHWNSDIIAIVVFSLWHVDMHIILGSFPSLFSFTLGLQNTNESILVGKQDSKKHILSNS